MLETRKLAELSACIWDRTWQRQDRIVPFHFEVWFIRCRLRILGEWLPPCWYILYYFFNSRLKVCLIHTAFQELTVLSHRQVFGCRRIDIFHIISIFLEQSDGSDRTQDFSNARRASTLTTALFSRPCMRIRGILIQHLLIGIITTSRLNTGAELTSETMCWSNQEPFFITQGGYLRVCRKSFGQSGGRVW